MGVPPERFIGVQELAAKSERGGKEKGDPRKAEGIPREKEETGQKIKSTL
jgi:hypothetical protein